MPDSPRDQHRRLGRRRLLDDAVDAADAGAVADDASEAALLAELTPQVPHFAQRLLPLDRFLQQDPQPLRIDRLAQVVVRAFLDCFDRTLNRALRGQQNERDVGELIFQRAQQFVPAHPRHDEIRHDDGRAEGGDSSEVPLHRPPLLRSGSPRRQLARPDRTVLRDRPLR